jgi:hypothetical protein
MEVPILSVMLDEEEWYPVYQLSTELDDDFYGHTRIQIPETLFERYKKAFDEFRAVQKILRGLNGT